MPTRVFATGTVRYDPSRCWNGYTLIPSLPGQSKAKGAALYDMNGRLVHAWEGLFGAFDNKLLPGGHILGTTGYMPGYWLDCLDVQQRDWNNAPVWTYHSATSITDLETGRQVPSARQHHDFQREGSPCGYYTPGQEPKLRGRMLINSTRTRDLPEFSPHPVADTCIMIIDEEGKTLWEWSLFDHWDQLGTETLAKAVHYHCAPQFPGAGYVKATYCNNVNWLGPNKWHDAGDARFHPENIITDIRILNVSFIIDHATGDIVWRLGPDFEYSRELQKIGQVIGQHEVHMIARGLPGEGNILLFDNGGQAGLGRPSPASPTGYYNATRGYSRVLEINPVTLEKAWTFNDLENFGGNVEALTIANQLFSPYCSGADRLPNGNTLITEMVNGRVLEVTPEGDVAWEFVNPGGKVFRAHRYPYAWCPLLPAPEERPVVPVPSRRIRIGADGKPYLAEDDPFYGESWE